MTLVSPEVNSHFSGDKLLKDTGPTTSEVIILGEDVTPLSEQQGISKQQEILSLFRRRAANLALAIGVSEDPKVKAREVKRFLTIASYDHSEPRVALEAQDFVMSIIDTMEMQTKTETAAALKSQNALLRQQIEAIKKAAMTLPVEALMTLAPLLELSPPVVINAEEFADEVKDKLIATQDIATPSTNELEAQLALQSDDTHSPIRGIAGLGRWSVGLLKKKS